jgi:hypothetical protein
VYARQYPPLPESLLSSLLEEDEVMPVSRELADQFMSEILLDSELDAPKRMSWQLPQLLPQRADLPDLRGSLRLPLL